MSVSWKSVADFLERRRDENPDFNLSVQITGVRLGDTGKTRWWVGITGESDHENAAKILDAAASVLRTKGSEQ